MADDRAALAHAGYDWLLPQWSAPPGVAALSTTRNGPGGDSGFDANARTLADAGNAPLAAWLPTAAVFVAQVHGADVVTLTAATLGATRATPPRADAIVTTLRGVPIAVRHADCLPVLFASADAGSIGAAHVGWRGLAAGVLEATIAAMAVAPATLHAWLGPAIGPAAFEVGDDVFAAFTQHDPGAAHAFVATKPGKWHADLYALARQRLARAGVTRISGGDACTFTDAARFFSYRRDGDARRMATVITRR